MHKDEYYALIELIEYHMNLYYNEDESEISDYEYDQLMIKLKAAEKEHPEWVTPNSPSQKVGGTVKREADVKGHEWKATIQRMISQDGCPICNNEKNTIASKYPQLIDFYDTEKNGGVSPEKQIASGIAYFWWKCKAGHSFLAPLNGVLQHKNTGCMYCDKEKSMYSIDGWMGFADKNKE